MGADCGGWWWLGAVLGAVGGAVCGYTTVHMLYKWLHGHTPTCGRGSESLSYSISPPSVGVWGRLPKLPPRRARLPLDRLGRGSGARVRRWGARADRMMLRRMPALCGEGGRGGPG